MAVAVAPAPLGVKAPDFRLPATDGRSYGLADVAGKNGTVVVFICNHCPYVKAVIGRMIADAKLLEEEGIGFVAISSNDAGAYPEDSFPNMKRFAEQHGFPFPYLHDETQAVAHAYDAVCTPDFFGISAAGLIEYRGRLDEGRKEQPRARRPPRPGRSDAPDRGHRQRPEGADPVGRLLDEVEERGRAD